RNLSVRLQNFAVEELQFLVRWGKRDIEISEALPFRGQNLNELLALGDDCWIIAEHAYLAQAKHYPVRRWVRISTDPLNLGPLACVLGRFVEGRCGQAWTRFVGPSA